MKPKFISIMLAVALAFVLTSSAERGVNYKVLHNFGAGKDGSGPFGPPVLDNKGNLYGVTGSGGAGQCSDYGCGTVFELMPDAGGKWKEAILHSFMAGNDGSAPWGVLIPDEKDSIYGTLHGDVGFAADGVFRLRRGVGGWTNTVIYENYAGPGLTSDPLGNLYGDMTPGQYKYYDAIAELSPNSNGWKYAALYSFCGQQGCPDGWEMPAPPMWDRKGNMFGTTIYGGIGQPACWISYGCGVVFEMTPNGDGTWTYTVLHRFLEHSSKDGQSPNGGLAIDSAGSLYGVTVYGGAYNRGRVFKLAFSDGQWKETSLYDFPNCNQGCLPAGTPVFDKAGNLYATASGGLVDCGGQTCGVIFKLSPQKNGKWKYSALYKLHGTDGQFLPYGVILDGKGNLFGTTPSGGKYGAGVAFEITP